MRVRSLASLSGLRIQCCLELWCRSKTWLGPSVAVAVCRPVAAAPIQPLAWELLYASGVALKSQKIKNKIKLGMVIVVPICEYKK